MMGTVTRIKDYKKKLNNDDVFYKSQFSHDGIYLNFNDKETKRFHEAMRKGYEQIEGLRKKALCDKLDKLIKECEEEK